MRDRGSSTGNGYSCSNSGSGSVLAPCVKFRGGGCHDHSRNHPKRQNPHDSLFVLYLVGWVLEGNCHPEQSIPPKSMMKAVALRNARPATGFKTPNPKTRKKLKSYPPSPELLKKKSKILKISYKSILWVFFSIFEHCLSNSGSGPGRGNFWVFFEEFRGSVFLSPCSWPGVSLGHPLKPSLLFWHLSWTSKTFVDSSSPFQSCPLSLFPLVDARWRWSCGTLHWIRHLRRACAVGKRSPNISPSMPIALPLGH